VYKPVSVEEYSIERKKELGEFLGPIIAGIYEGIQNGTYNVESDFEKAAGRPHKSAIEMIKELKRCNTRKK
jgi:NAD(P)H dehydrogenase (quinone)